MNLEEIMNRNQDVSQNGPNGDVKNNRYANVVDDFGRIGSDAAANGKTDIRKAAAVVQNNEVNDNGAHEVNDNNDFIVDERSHKGHMHDALGDNKLHAINNAAEEDMNLYDHKFNLAKPKEAGDGSDARNNNGDGKHLDKNDNKLLNEIDGDQGKVVYPDEIRMEEQLEEEDGKYN